MTSTPNPLFLTVAGYIVLERSPTSPFSPLSSNQILWLVSQWGLRPGLIRHATIKQWQHYMLLQQKVDVFLYASIMVDLLYFWANQRIRTNKIIKPKEMIAILQGQYKHINCILEQQKIFIMALKLKPR